MAHSCEAQAPPAPGDGPALEALWARSYDALVRLAWLLVGQRSAAEDVVSTVWLRTLPRLADLADPLPYLRRAVINACHNHWRDEATASRGRARLTVQWADQVDDTTVELIDVLEQLPTRQRAVVVLRHLYGYSDPEIAELLACRVATVRSHARHGLAKLKEALR